MTNSIGEIDNAGVIFVIGANPTEAHPVIGYRLKMAAKNGATLIVADPRQIELVDYADVFFKAAPGNERSAA
jgi:formate dehydrogenase alpha subunit